MTYIVVVWREAKRWSCPEVKNMNDPSCDRCGKVYNPYVGHRFWFGRWNETADDGTEATYETLCNGCHRSVARRN
jgi:hypothetical protein